MRGGAGRHHGARENGLAHGLAQDAAHAAQPSGQVLVAAHGVDGRGLVEEAGDGIQVGRGGPR